MSTESVKWIKDHLKATNVKGIDTNWCDGFISALLTFEEIDEYEYKELLKWIFEQ